MDLAALNAIQEIMQTCLEAEVTAKLGREKGVSRIQYPKRGFTTAERAHMNAVREKEIEELKTKRLFLQEELENFKNKEVEELKAKEAAYQERCKEYREEVEKYNNQMKSEKYKNKDKDIEELEIKRAVLQSFLQKEYEKLKKDDDTTV